MAASPSRRTPKSGLLRRWILLPERNKLIIVAIASVVGFVVFKSVFFRPIPDVKEVSHVITPEEREAEIKKIKERMEREHQAQLDQILENTRQQQMITNQLLQEEYQKEVQNKQLIEELTRNMTALNEQSQREVDAANEEYKRTYEGVLSAKLAKAQKEIIETRASEMLTWFCNVNLDAEEMPMPVTEHVLDLGEQPCIGVASQDDPPIPVRRYSISSPDVARTVAAQALASLKARNQSDVYSFSKLAERQYDPRTEDRCCDGFVFGVHPVFGVFYKIRIAMQEKQVAADDETFYHHTVCFRRKFDPKPKVQPLTTSSVVDHLTHPEKLNVPTLPGSKRRLGDADTFPPGTVHIVLPFRAQRLDIFPSLIKNFGRIKQVTEGRDSAPFRLVIAPVSWDSEGMVSDAKARMEAMIAAASSALDIPIALAEPIAEEDMTKEKLVDLVRPWLDTSEKLLKDIQLSENADPVAAGVLPNPWLAAVAGALRLVPSIRAPVLILDSATYSLPNNLVKKALWRIVNGRMIYSPIAAAMSYPIEAGFLLSDGGVSKTDEELEETGETASYTDPAFWADVEDINRFMEFPDEEDGVRRRLRATADAAKPDAVRAARRATLHASGRKLLAEDEGGEEEEEEEEQATPAYASEEDDYYRDTMDPYGDEFQDYLMSLDDEVGTNEWDAWDPDTLDSEGLFGLGDGQGDTNAPHNYFFSEDSYEDFDQYYEDLADDDTELLHKRVTTLGATKSDMASMIFRVLEAKTLTSSERIATPQADNCLMLRMVSAARRSKYRIVRTVVPGMYVDKTEFALGTGDPEVWPCECDYDTRARHCRLVLSQTEVDDPIDETRVNCVITSMLSAEQQKKVAKEHDGAAEDIDVAKLVKVTHAVRFFKPSKGIEIIAKVLKADPARRVLGSSKKPTPVGPEVFTFQWHVSNTIKVYE